jgi:hypothetical protein
MITPVVSVVTFAVALQSASAESPEQLNQALVNQAQDCRLIVNDKQRLSCFDNLFKLKPLDPLKQIMPFEKNPETADSTALSTKPTKLPASKTQASDLPKTIPTETALPKVIIDKNEADNKVGTSIEEFGAEHLKIDKAKEQKLEVVSFTIEKVGKTLRNNQRFYFTNGQIWENKGSKDLRVKVGDEVQIKDGALSAFYLSKIDGNRSVRVKRVK